jgi:hypothetical protein
MEVVTELFTSALVIMAGQEKVIIFANHKRSQKSKIHFYRSFEMPANVCILIETNYKGRFYQSIFPL